MNYFDKLKSIVDGVEGDMTAFYQKGNKAAGTRVRKAMQDLKALAQEIRVDIQDKKA